MLPSFIVILMGLDPTRILVMSQVLLSFGIALALVPLLIFTSNKTLMGELVNSTLVKRAGWAIVVVVVALNLWLLIGTALAIKKKGASMAPFLLMMYVAVTMSFPAVTPAAAAVVTVVPAFTVTALICVVFIPAAMYAIIMSPPAVIRAIHNDGASNHGRASSHRPSICRSRHDRQFVILLDGNRVISPALATSGAEAGQ